MSKKRFVNSYIAFAQKHRCRGSQKKALAIYQAASDGIVTRSPNTTTSLALSQCLLMLKQASSSADLILRQMQSIAYTMPEYSIVRSMHGVGDRLALSWLLRLEMYGGLPVPRPLMLMRVMMHHLISPGNLKEPIGISQNVDQLTYARPAMRLCIHSRYISPRMPLFTSSSSRRNLKVSTRP